MNKAVVIIIAAIVVVAGGYFILNRPAKEAQAPVVSKSPTPEESAPEPLTGEKPVITENAGDAAEAEEPEIPREQTVRYTNSGYVPQVVTIKKGGTVTWINESSRGMWTASAFHPSHTVYAGTSLQEHCGDPSARAFDECASANPGESWSFTFTKTGSWNYHNHVAPSDFGTVVVEE